MVAHKISKYYFRDKDDGLLAGSALSHATSVVHDNYMNIY